MNFLGGLGDFGDFDGDRFAENIPPRLVRLKRLVIPIILDIYYYEYIMNIL